MELRINLCNQNYRVYKHFLYFNLVFILQFSVLVSNVKKIAYDH